MARPRRLRGLVIVVAAALLATLGTGSAAHADPVYPSWDDVQAAQGNARATARQVASIQGHLDDLESRAVALSVASLEKGEKYNQARDALATATTRVAALEAQADAAAESARQSAAQAGQLVAQLARAGGGDITTQLFVDSADADDLLYRLGTMSKLAERSATVIARAQTDENAARALGDQAARARDQRETLTAEAEVVLDEARAASAVAEAEIAEKSAAAEQLVAQLIALTGSADATTQGYLDGLARQQQAVRPPVTTPAAPGAPESPGTPVAPSPTTPTAPTTPPVVVPPVVAPPVVAPPVVAPPVVVPPVVAPPVTAPGAPNSGVVAAAIAFARAQVGDAYEFAGSGPDSWDCSGLTKASYSSVGVYIGTHSATNQYSTMANSGRLVPVGQRVAGDLLFYANGGSAGGEKYHTAIFVGGGQMIEAPRPGVPVRVTGVRSADLVPYAGRPTG